MARLEEALQLKYPPLAVYYSQEMPEGAKISSPICAMLLLAQAAKGETVALSKESCPCSGAASGFGLDKFR